jgi:hypothetical protein
MRTFLLLPLLAIAACGGGSTPPDTDAGIDASTDPNDSGPGTDAQSLPEGDAGIETDAGAEADAPMETDAPTGADAPTGLSCATGVETPVPGGVCDGRGRIACEMWADTNAGAGRDGQAVCIMTGPGSMLEGCARATFCTDFSIPATCVCGTQPACARDQVCVRMGAGFGCACIMDAP